MLCKDTQDKEKPVSGIRDDEIRKDGMCRTAAADKAQDNHLIFNWPAIYEIDNPSAIISVDPAVALGSTAGAGFQFRAERAHIRIKEYF